MTNWCLIISDQKARLLKQRADSARLEAASYKLAYVIRSLHKTIQLGIPSTDRLNCVS